MMCFGIALEASNENALIAITCESKEIKILLYAIVEPGK